MKTSIYGGKPILLKTRRTIHTHMHMNNRSIDSPVRWEAEPYFPCIPSMLASCDWRLRHAGLIAVAAIGEGTSKVMQNELGKVVELVMRNSHLRVRYAACQYVAALHRFRCKTSAITMADGRGRGYSFTKLFKNNSVDNYSRSSYRHSKHLSLGASSSHIHVPSPSANRLFITLFGVHSHAAAVLINFCEGVERDTLVPYLDPIPMLHLYGIGCVLYKYTFFHSF